MKQRGPFTPQDYTHADHNQFFKFLLDVCDYQFFESAEFERHIPTKVKAITWLVVIGNVNIQFKMLYKIRDLMLLNIQLGVSNVEKVMEALIITFCTTKFH